MEKTRAQSDLPVWRKIPKTLQKCPYIYVGRFWRVFGIFLQTGKSDWALVFFHWLSASLALVLIGHSGGLRQLWFLALYWGNQKSNLAGWGFFFSMFWFFMAWESDNSFNHAMQFLLRLWQYFLFDKLTERLRRSHFWPREWNFKKRGSEGVLFSQSAVPMQPRKIRG